MNPGLKLAGLALALHLGARQGHCQRWTELTPSTGPAPEARQHATAVYDEAGHRMLVFGGRNASRSFNDVWAFDLGSNAWSELLAVPGPAPAERITPNGVYDPQNGWLIIWSGQGSGFYNDVWSFDPSALEWLEHKPPLPRPNTRYGAASVWDPVARDLVTFAGFTDQGRFDDTWRFSVDEAAWTEVSPDLPGRPPRRCLHSASYDSLERRYLLYGGQQSGPLDDLWAFDLEHHGWTDLTPQDRPPGRYFAANVYDALRHRVLIFGGHRASGVTNEVWAFDLGAGAWQQIAPAGTAPSAREGATGIYIPSQDRLLVFGGSSSNQVWALDLEEESPVKAPAPGGLGLAAAVGLLGLIYARLKR